MPLRYFLHSGRRKHYWKICSEGFRPEFGLNGRSVL